MVTDAAARRGEVHPSGLWVPKQVNVTKLRPRVRTVTLPDGQRAKATYEPTSGDGKSAVIHIERAEGIDAVVRPKQVLLRVRSGA
jgi:hypothetical protein